ncbi:MAG: PorV/PorQ family protein [Bacteroidota bacterium]
MKNILFALQLHLVFATVVFPQTVIGKYGGEFLSLGAGGRSQAMGGASVAFINDATAGYWNPSALSTLQSAQISLMHEERFGNLLNYDFASIAIPMENKTSIGASLIRLAADENYDTRGALIDVNTGGVIYDVQNPSARIDPLRIKQFSVVDWAMFLSYAQKYSDELSFGANVKFIRRENAEYSATGVGFDIGAKYFYTEKIFFGAMFRDVTTTFLVWNTGRNELITPTFVLGTAYQIETPAGKFSPAFDIDVRFENRQTASNLNIGAVSFDFHSGLEYSYHEIFFLRAGYNDIGAMSYGGGIQLKKLSVDYSLSQSNSFPQSDNTQRISLLFSLGN